MSQDKELYITLPKIRALQESISWLDNYQPKENEEHYIGESLDSIDTDSTDLLRELGEINQRRVEIVKILVNKQRALLASTFLSTRNPFDEVDQNKWIWLLTQYQEKFGDEGLIALAGFYIYAVQEIGGDRGSNAIQETFNHDIYGMNDKHMLPRSSSYEQFFKL